MIILLLKIKQKIRIIGIMEKFDRKNESTVDSHGKTICENFLFASLPTSFPYMCVCMHTYASTCV